MKTKRTCGVCGTECTEAERVMQWDPDRDRWVPTDRKEYICDRCLDGAAT
jgi:hypothetical protein